MRNAGAMALRYQAQTIGYLLLLTPSYPYSGPSRARPASAAAQRPRAGPGAHGAAPGGAAARPFLAVGRRGHEPSVERLPGSAPTGIVSGRRLLVLVRG